MDTDEDFENESTCEESEGSQDEELEISTLQIDIVDLPEPANIDKAPVHIPITQNEDCLKATALIDGGKIDVILDTGARMSVIPSSFVKQNKIKWHKKVTECVVGHGQTIASEGITESLDVIIFGSHTKIEFLILPRKDCLLGTDWFNRSRFIPILYERKIIFAQREIHLDPTFDEQTSLNALDTPYPTDYDEIEAQDEMFHDTDLLYQKQTNLKIELENYLTKAEKL